MRSSITLSKSLWCMAVLVFIASCKDHKKTGHGGIPEAKQEDITQTAGQKEPEKMPSTVAEIKAAYASIIAKAANGTLDSLSFKYSCNGEKSGQVSYFSENGILQMIVHRYSAYDHFTGIDRYFGKGSKLFFANQNSTSWSFESGPEGSTRDNIKEQRVYLIDQEPVLCLEKQYVVRSQASDNPQPENVPNRQMDCGSLNPVLASYDLLLQYKDKAPEGCLEK